MASYDVIIAGAGIIGLSLALELHEGGAHVLVLERGRPGGEASSAAAGMLAATDPETPMPLRALAIESAHLFPVFVEKLESATRVDVDFRRHGTIVLSKEETMPENYQPLSGGELQKLEPNLAGGGHNAYFVAEDSVDPASLMTAALRSAAQRGVEVRSGIDVRKMQSSGGQVEIITEQGPLLAAKAVNCRGAWSGPPVRPRKGQMLYLGPADSSPLTHVVRSPEAYIVPRSSGKILVGATVEDVGYDKTVEPETIRNLHTSASACVPELASAPVIASWAGLRPGSPDDLPLIGETEKGIFIASGHFRNGILLAPVTAHIMANLISGRAPGFEISAFAPQRFPSALCLTGN